MNKRDFLKGMVATAAGVMVPAHVLAESKYEFHSRMNGLKPVKEAPSGPVPIASDGGVDWYGEVSADDLITGDALAAEIEFKGGVPINAGAGWLHVGIDGTELLIAKRPFRHVVSWAMLNAANAVTGNTVLTIDGVDYKLRLLKTFPQPIEQMSAINLVDPVDCAGSEYNRIIYRLIGAEDFKDDTLEPYTPIANYTGGDLVIVHNGSPSAGAWTITQESASSLTLMRGYYSPSQAKAAPAGASYITTGWRPVLEKV
jgi:hypothetical protein